MKLKRIIFVLFVSLLIVSCGNKQPDFKDASKTPPDTNILTDDYNLDFTAMHNYVIDALQADLTPFFYIKNGSFDISGDNEKKEINISCKCADGCIEKDVDLFYSMVLNLVAFSASEQDYRFKKPSVDSDGTYLDFGTVFNTYTLKLYAETESGEVLKNIIVTKGYPIPIEPRYIKES